MSADNGIYILKTKRTRIKEKNIWSKQQEHHVFRITHASGIDNFDYIRENQLYNLGAYMKEVWGKSEVFLDLDSAEKAAQALHNKIEYVEYGISHIDASDMIFYGDM